MARVLLHSLVFSPDSVSTAYLMTELAVELKRRGHAVTVLTTTPHYNIDVAALARQPLRRHWAGLLYESAWEGIPIWHVKLPMKGTRVWARALDYMRFHVLSLVVSASTVGRQDIVIATSPPLTIGVMSWLLGLRWRGPSVYKVAEVYPDIAIRQGVVRHPALIAAMRWLERFVYARNTMIVPITGQFKRVIQMRGVPESKLRSIPDFVDTDLYRPLPRDNPFAVAHGLVGRFVVLYGGNIGLVQDWDAVLWAAERAADLPIDFVIVGDGARRAWLTEAVQQRRLQNVKLLGYQPKELMPQINASCDVATIPMTRSGAQDGFPSKIYTIMACAKPVIATAAADSEMALMITQAGCGRVVAPEDKEAYADAVLAAFRDRTLLPAEGERGRRFVEKDYSKEAIALRYDELIRDLVGA